MFLIFYFISFLEENMNDVSMRKGFVLLTAAAMLLALNSGVFAGGGSQAASGTSAGSGGPFKITIQTRQSTGEIPGSDHPIIQAIEKIANVDLEVNFIPNAAYDEKLSVTVASNDYPMLTLFTGNAKPSTMEVETVRAGVFWKVGDYLKRYKWLSELDDGRIGNASVDGELWGMFRWRPSVRDGFFYRKDWADKLGIAPPKNMNELYAMLKAFVEKDPDGNGRADTHGIAQEQTLDQVIQTLAPAFGLGNGYDVVNGKLIPIHLQPAYLEELKFIKRLYDDGLMNRDFPTIVEARRDEMMGSGQYGMVIDSIDKGWFSFVPLQKIYPNATFTVQVHFADSKAPIWGRAGYDGKFYVSKKAVKDEASMLKVMEYFNHMYSPEVNNLVYCGLENVHYTKTGPNTITISDEQRQRFGIDVQPMEQIAMRYQKNNYEIENIPEYDKQLNNFYYNYPGETVSNPTWVLNSETFNERNTELGQMIEDAAIQYVTGAINDQGWAAVLARWRREGGDRIIAEYQAEYDKIKK
jgi:putative aldouronate transport system substrate-binding protein